MCISFLYFTNNQDSNIRSLILFNREEFLNRAAKPLGFHPINGVEQDVLLFPLDVPTQGTFFCINIKNGNFSFLLNNPFSHNEYNPKCKLKRGSLPIEFCNLSSEENSWNNFFLKLNAEKSEYNGYNIICGNFKIGVVKYFTNNIYDIKFNSLNIINDENQDFKSNNITNLKITSLINPISNKEYKIFNSDIPLNLKNNNIYVISNTFIFDPVKRVDYGGKIFRNLLKRYNETFNSNKDCGIFKNKNLDDNLNLQGDNSIKSNDGKNKCFDDNRWSFNENFETNNLLDHFIKILFIDLLENRKKFNDTYDEVKNILKKEKNWFENPIFEEYHSSSLFLDDKIEEFYTEYGTRNSIAVVFDNQNTMRIFNYEDRVKEENGYLTNEERDYENLIMKWEIII